MGARCFPAAVFAAILLALSDQSFGQRSLADQPLETRIENLSREIAAGPADPDLFLQRARLFGEGSRWDDMVRDLDQAIEINPTAEAYYDRGFCYQRLGDFRAAVADYTEAQRLDPNLVNAICERSDAYVQLGEFSRALEDLEYCRRHNPDDIRVKLSLAWLLATSPDAGVRSGRRALVLAGEVCDPVTCQTVEPLNALAAAHAELGEYAKAEVLMERAAALSHFAPDFRKACVRRLETVRRREPIREARTPLVLQPRVTQKMPRDVTLDEALAAPADVLAIAYLSTKSMVLLCTIAKGGATIDGWLDGQPLLVTSENAARVEQQLKERQAVYREAITRRGYRRLAAGYASKCEGDCRHWGIDEMPVLVEQHDFDLFLTQGDTRHQAVVVESTVGLRHDANTDVMITGEITEDAIVFQTPRQGGVTGMAEERCTWRLVPAEVQGPDWAVAFVGRAMAHRSYGEHAAMIADLDRSLELNPVAQVAAMKAFLLATCADERVRDGKLAVEAAELARSLANGKIDVDLAAALAVAYAEAGDFATAIEYQKQLIDLVPDEGKPLQREHLRMFEARKPFHEPARF